MAATFRTSAAGGGTSGTSNRTAAITAAVGDLLLVFCNASGNTNASPTCTDNQTGGTYTLVGTALKNGSTDILSVFVRNNLVSSAVSHTVTVATGSNTAAEIVIVAVSGMVRTGTNGAVRSSGFQANQAASGTPAPALSRAALTANFTATCVANGTAGGSVIVPNASWTERQDVSQSTPTTGIEVATRDSGFTGTMITQGGTSATAFASAAIELDGSTPQSKSASANAVVQAHQSISANANAVVQAHQSLSPTANAIVQAQQAVGTGANAVVQAHQSLSPTANAIVQAAQTIGTSANAVVTTGISSHTITTSADSVVQASQALSAGVSAVVQAHVVESTNANAVIQAHLSVNAGASAVVQAAQSISTGSDAVVQAHSSLSPSASAIVQAHQQVVASGSAVVQARQALAAGASAVVQGDFSRTASADAVVQADRYLSIGGDAVVQASQSRAASADAVVQAAQSLTTGGNAVVQATQSRTSSANAVVQDVQPLTLSSDANAVIQDRQNITAGANAVVIEGDPPDPPDPPKRPFVPTIGQTGSASGGGGAHPSSSDFESDDSEDAEDDTIVGLVEPTEELAKLDIIVAASSLPIAIRATILNVATHERGNLVYFIAPFAGPPDEVFFSYLAPGSSNPVVDPGLGQPDSEIKRVRPQTLLMLGVEPRDGWIYYICTVDTTGMRGGKLAAHFWGTGKFQASGFVEVEIKDRPRQLL